MATPHIVLNPADRELGTALQQVNSFQDALEQTHLNFEVKRGPIFFQAEGEDAPRRYDKRYATYRTDTQEPLGVVTPNYRIIQNRDAFTEFEPFLQDNQITLTHARVLMNGARLALLGKLREPIKVVDEEVYPYLLFVNSHDGRTACIVQFSPIRVTCTNMLPVGIRRKGAQRIKRVAEHVAVKHTGDTQDKLRDAATTLALAREYFLEFTEDANFLTTREVKGEHFKKFFERVFKAPEKQEDWSSNLKNKFETISALFDESEFSPRTRHTWWAAFNVIAEYLDWRAPATGAISERTIRSSWMGAARSTKRRAFEIAMDYAIDPS